MSKVNESKQTKAKKSINLPKIKCMLDNIGFSGSSFPRYVEGIIYQMNNEPNVEISANIINHAKRYADRYAKLYRELSRELSKLEAGTYSTDTGKLVDPTSLYSKLNDSQGNVDRLKELLIREGEVKEHLTNGGFEESIEYKEELMKITQEIVKLVIAIDGKWSFREGSTLFKLQEEIRNNNQ